MIALNIPFSGPKEGPKDMRVVMTLVLRASEGVESRNDVKR